MHHFNRFAMAGVSIPVILFVLMMTLGIWGQQPGQPEYQPGQPEYGNAPSVEHKVNDLQHKVNEVEHKVNIDPSSLKNEISPDQLKALSGMGADQQTQLATQAMREQSLTKEVLGFSPADVNDAVQQLNLSDAQFAEMKDLAVQLSKTKTELPEWEMQQFEQFLYEYPDLALEGGDAIINKILFDAYAEGNPQFMSALAKAQYYDSLKAGLQAELKRATDHLNKSQEKPDSSELKGEFQTLDLKSLPAVQKAPDTQRGITSNMDMWTFKNGIPGRLKWSDPEMKFGKVEHKAGMLEHKTGDAEMKYEKTRATYDQTSKDTKTGGPGGYIVDNKAAPAQWDFKNAWPSKVSGPQPKADGPNSAIEELEIAHEGLAFSKAGRESDASESQRDSKNALEHKVEHKVQHKVEYKVTQSLDVAGHKNVSPENKAQWDFKNAWPSKVSGPAPKADGNELLRKKPGRLKWNDITLKRGVMESESGQVEHKVEHKVNQGTDAAEVKWSDVTLKRGVTSEEDGKVEIKIGVAERSPDASNQWKADVPNVKSDSLKTSSDPKSSGVKVPALDGSSKAGEEIKIAMPDTGKKTGSASSEWKNAANSGKELQQAGVVMKGGADNVTLENYIKQLESQLQSVGEDAQLANMELQNQLQKQQQTLQMMSNISKSMHETQKSVIRNIK